MSQTITTTPTRVQVPLVRLESVAVTFGGLRALGGVDLDVARGERLAILGPNGAGKTTLFNVIAGDITATEGRVVIKGHDCTHVAPRFRPRLGVARTYQKTRLFAGLTVEDNIYLALIGRTGRHFSMRVGRRDRELRTLARETAQLVWMADELNTIVGDLSHGEQRQLEIGLAVSTEPDVMMLDEPASGLSRGERQRLIELLEGLAADRTVLLIEHDMDVALRVADRVVVMADGIVVAHGTPDEIRHDPLVHSIYMGNESMK
jgi:branched-chain amino acid transport system ATP-binding protein